MARSSSIWEMITWQNNMRDQLNKDRAFWLFCQRETYYIYFDNNDFPKYLYDKLYNKYYNRNDMFKITDANEYDYVPSEYERRNDLSPEFKGQVIPGKMYKVKDGKCVDLRVDYVSTFVPREGAQATVKDGNPKDAVGISKVPSSTIPAQVMGELGLAMMEGALKYGRSNYRVAGVRASVYYDAVMARHMPSWWEGEDLDPDSRLSHVTKAIASLVVLRDAMMQDNWIDDRPPPAKNKNWIKELNTKAADLLNKYPNPKPAFTKDNS